jgi:hypothetical protein
MMVVLPSYQIIYHYMSFYKLSQYHTINYHFSNIVYSTELISLLFIKLNSDTMIIKSFIENITADSFHKYNRIDVYILDKYFV